MLYEFRYKGISLAIARALIRSMTASEVLENFSRDFSQEYKIYRELIERLGKLCEMDSSNISHVRQLTLELIEQESQVPSANRQKLDKALGSLVSMLTVEEQRPLAVKFIRCRRIARRRAGLKIISQHFLPEYKELLLDCFELSQDEWALTTLTRVDANISDIGDTLLDNIHDLYEQARVFEKLIMQDSDQASKLAIDYPIAFVWGAGRTRCSKCLPVVLKILRDRRKDYENLGLIVWSLGQLGARTELQKLAIEHNVQHFEKVKFRI